MGERTTREASWSYQTFVLTSAAVAYKGEMAFLNLGTGIVDVGQTSTALLPIGVFAESLTGDGTTEVNVRLSQELKANWWDNDSGTAVASTDVGNNCYAVDGHTVSMDSTGRSIAGRVLKVDATKGVLVVNGLYVTGPTGVSAIGAVAATKTALKAIPAASRYNGKTATVTADGSQWVFAASSTAADTSEQLVLTPAAGSGRWLRIDKSFVMDLPITYATADAAVLHTVPAGFVLRLVSAPYYDITTQFAGGSSSSIGASSSKSGYSTKGDLISATLTAALTTGNGKGALGDKVDSAAELHALTLVAADTILHDRIVSAYTSGVGSVRVPVIVCTMPAIA